MVYSFTIKCLEQGVFMFGDERSTLNMVYSFAIKCLEQGVFMFGDERSTLIGVRSLVGKIA